MDYSFTKIIQNGNSYYFATTWNVRFGEVKLVLFHNGTCYDGAVSVKDFESFSAQTKVNTNEFWEQSMNIWNNNSNERKDIEVKHNDLDSSVTLIWKKMLPNSPIKQRMGSTNLNQNIKSGNNFFDYLVNVVGSQKQKIESLKDEKDAVELNYIRALEKLNELADIKEDVEKHLFSKFVLVLNQKKEKIRSLKSELENKEPCSSNATEFKKRSQKVVRIPQTKQKRKYISDESTSSSDAEATDDSRDVDEAVHHAKEEDMLGVAVAADDIKQEDDDDVRSDTDDDLLAPGRNPSLIVDEDDLDETQEMLDEPPVQCSQGNHAGPSHEEELEPTQKLSDSDECNPDSHEVEDAPANTSKCSKPAFNNLHYLDDLI